MYLCIGTLLKLIDLYSNGVYGKLEICQELFSFTESDYNKSDASELINCNMNIKKNERNYIRNFNLQNDRQYNRLHDLLESTSNFILRDALPMDNIGPFIQSILTIMESDDRLVNDFGMNPEYTKENVFSNFKELDATEFIINILYYCYILKDNRSGKDTVVYCLTQNFIKEQSFAANNIFIRNINGDNRYTYRKNYSDEELPHELTPNTTVIDGSSLSILYREDSFHSIVNAIKSNESKSVYLYGMGGCGKTSIARMVYSHLKDCYDCCGWINYSGNLKQSMIDSITLDEYSDETMTEYDSQKKWQLLQRKLTNSKQTKLFVIDNVDYIEQIQDPRTDKDLISMSAWDNTTIIITSRIASITGYTTKRILINNLGDRNNDEKCIELFYHYNESAASNRDTNHEVVANLCALADYNTMVIELLAKGSYYYGEDLDEFYQDLLKNNFSCANDTLVSTEHDFTVIKTTDADNYYDIGNETVATQIYKLFNLKTRSELEQLILWDFHCLKENEKVTRKELKNWMGYDPKDFDKLVNEGWIKFQDNLFFIHPLVNQAIACANPDAKKYWELKSKLLDMTNSTNKMIPALLNNTFFLEEDSFELSLRKLLFADCLTYNGDFLTATQWLNIADFARRRGNIKLGVKYYSKAYNYFKTYVPSNYDNYVKFGKSTYFYGYMLSYTKVNYQRAEELLNHSLEISEHIVDDEGMTDANMLMLATSLDHLGYILSNSLNNDIQRITKADYYLTESVNMRYSLCQANPNNFRLLHDYAWSLDNLGAFYANININKIYFYKNPNSSDIIYLTKDELIESKKQSELLLLEALNIRKKLAKVRAESNSTEVAWTYYNLANLLISLNINNINDSTITNPKGIYFKLHEDMQSSFADLELSETAYAYSNLASLLSSQNSRTIDAEQYIKDALMIYHNLDIKYPGQHQSSEARTTVLYARLLSKSEIRKQEAVELYDKALKLYQLLNSDNNGAYIEEINTIKEEIECLEP